MPNFNYEDNRIFLSNEAGEKIGEICFERVNENTYDITHTYVSPEYRGKHFAEELVNEAIRYIKQKNCNVTASCSYAKRILEKMQ